MSFGVVLERELAGPDRLMLRRRIGRTPLLFHDNCMIEDLPMDRFHFDDKQELTAARTQVIILNELMITTRRDPRNDT